MFEGQINNIIRRFLDLLKKLKFPYRLCAKLFTIYHLYIIKKLSNIFLISYELYKKSYHMNMKNRKDAIQSDKKVWVFWWQGYKDMPCIVRTCIRSIYNHSSNHKVIFLDKYNVRKYAKLPNYIYTKVSKGTITLTNFSDILEFNLLRNYGGLWIDATVFCASDLPAKCFNRLFTASGGYPKYRDNISLGRWTGFLFGGDAQQPLFIFMDILFKLYWKYYNYLVDYFLIDYSLNYAYIHNIGGFKNYVKCQVTPKPNIYKMANYLNKKYDLELYRKLVKNTTLFKLTYKKRFKKRRNTLYYILVHKF